MLYPTAACKRRRRRRRRRQPEPLDACGLLTQSERTWLERGRRTGVALVAVTADRLSVDEGARVVVSILLVAAVRVKVPEQPMARPRLPRRRAAPRCATAVIWDLGPRCVVSISPFPITSSK